VRTHSNASSHKGAHKKKSVDLLKKVISPPTQTMTLAELQAARNAEVAKTRGTGTKHDEDYSAEYHIFPQTANGPKKEMEPTEGLTEARPIGFKKAEAGESMSLAERVKLKSDRASMDVSKLNTEVAESPLNASLVTGLALPYITTRSLTPLRRGTKAGSRRASPLLAQSGLQCSVFGAWHHLAKVTRQVERTKARPVSQFSQASASASSVSVHVPSFNLPSFQMRHIGDPGVTLPMVSEAVARSMHLEPASKEVNCC
jgi:hypothetical protein